jgi:hypothetical protein
VPNVDQAVIGNDEASEKMIVEPKTKNVDQKRSSYSVDGEADAKRQGQKEVCEKIQINHARNSEKNVEKKPEQQDSVKYGQKLHLLARLLTRKLLGAVGIKAEDFKPECHR